MKDAKTLVGVAVASFIGMVAATTPSRAAITSFIDPSAFDAALAGSPTITETYEALALGTLIPSGATVNGITYNSFPIGTAGGLVTSAFNAIGSQSLATDRLESTQDFFFPGESFSVSFTSPIRAVGIYFNVVNSPALNPYLYVNTPVGTATGGGAGDVPDISSLFFVGLISDVSFGAATFGATLDAPSGYNVDNLIRASIPEPATLMLLGLGLAGLGFSRRKR